VAAVIFTSLLSKEILEPVVSPQRSVLLHNYVPALELGPQQQDETRRGFLAVGRLSPEKGFDQLVKAWPASQKLTILGDGPERARLETLATGKDIHFKGFVPDSERDHAVQSAQALILPSITKEADPVVVAQALSCGTPCIARTGTATAQLAETSTAVLTYKDSSSLMTALEDVDYPYRREAARRLYENTWSDTAWLRGFHSQVVEPLGIQAAP
jgi:glycosyltransferase involved in cell wall biosynthesis